MANAGMVTPEIDVRRLERDIEKLTKYCREKGVNRKSMIQGKIPLYNAKFKKSENKIKGDTHYIGILISNVWSELNKFKMERIEKEIEKQKEIQKNVKYIKGDDFPTFVLINVSFVLNFYRVRILIKLWIKQWK